MMPSSLVFLPDTETSQHNGRLSGIRLADNGRLVPFGVSTEKELFFTDSLEDSNTSLQGKYAGLFVSTGTLGGGQESTAIAAMSTLAHHGFIYVPLGYKTTFSLLADMSEVRGGSAWGAGTFSVSDVLLFGKWSTLTEWSPGC